MKPIFLFTLIAISSLVSAQPYQSIFGNTSTMWIIKWYNLDFGGNDTIVVVKDTLAYGFIWKKISVRPTVWIEGLLREDTLTGKVWYHPLDPGRDSTYLSFDYSLDKKDTFDLSTNYEPFLTQAIVDSTFFDDDRKRIRFNSFIENAEHITFIEGVTGNQGPIYKESSGLGYPYLLCAYKDGIQTYSNISYNGDCSPPTGINQIDHTEEIVVYPNPVEDVLYINNTSDILFKKVEIFDALGRKIYSDGYSSSLNLHDTMPGLYYIRFITVKGNSIIKTVVHQ
ncbi:MAG TPA: T9SS type A sorting domain-containing protein [Saprospiraceae bacterium]|nr:T9SS type A sorting domain-containing protein [Saprospiraceae bacterium]